MRSTTGWPASTRGADDYLAKPFAFAELLARLRALVRRGAGRAPGRARGRRPPPRPGDAPGLARRDARSSCPRRSSRCSRPSCAAPGDVLSRLELLEHAWDYDYENRSNVVDVYVRYLREKIDRPFGASSIETVRGAGYRLREDGGVAEPAADPPAADARLRRRDGHRPRGGRDRSSTSALGDDARRAGRRGPRARAPRRSPRSSAQDASRCSPSERRSSARGELRAGARPRRPVARRDAAASARRCSRATSSARARRDARSSSRGDGASPAAARLLGAAGRRRAASSSSAPRSSSATRRSTTLAHALLVGGPLALLLASRRRLRARRGARCGRSRRCAAAPAQISRRPAERAPARAGGATTRSRRLGETLNEMLARIDDGLRARARASSPTPATSCARRSRSSGPSSSSRCGAAASAGGAASRARSAAEETDRLAQLAEDLLVLARADAGGCRCGSSRSAATSCSRRSRGASPRRAADAGRRLEVERRRRAGARGDRLRLEQALGNLVDNALRYGAGTVALAARARDGAVELHVARRRGRASRPAFLPHAFERFSRAGRGALARRHRARPGDRRGGRRGPWRLGERGQRRRRGRDDLDPPRLGARMRMRPRRGLRRRRVVLQRYSRCRRARAPAPHEARCPVQVDVGA